MISRIPADKSMISRSPDKSMIGRKKSTNSFLGTNQSLIEDFADLNIENIELTNFKS